MSENAYGTPELNFIEFDEDSIKNKIIRSYEEKTNRVLSRADPMYLVLLWLSGIIIQERMIINETAKQNIPRYATGEHLDALSDFFSSEKRDDGIGSTTLQAFYINQALGVDYVIPKGTRVFAGEGDGKLTFELLEPVTIKAGELCGVGAVRCQVPGTIGNGLLAGSITGITDVYQFFDRTENLDITEGGRNTQTDEEYYESMRQSRESFSTAGSFGSYEYFIKKQRGDIADVRAYEGKTTTVLPAVLIGNKLFFGGDYFDTDTLKVFREGEELNREDYSSEYKNGLLIVTLGDNVETSYTHSFDESGNATASSYYSFSVEIEKEAKGEVDIYVLLENGAIPSTDECKVLENVIMSNRDVKAITDKVRVMSAEKKECKATVTYYLLPDDTVSAEERALQVESAVESWKTWQTGKIGRKYNFSELHHRIMSAGVSRCDINIESEETVDKYSFADVSYDSITIEFGGTDYDADGQAHI